jgi:hypothetical protein
VAELLVELEVLEARVAVRVGVGPRVAVEAQEARTEFAPHLVCKRDAHQIVGAKVSRASSRFFDAFIVDIDHSSFLVDATVLFPSVTSTEDVWSRLDFKLSRRRRAPRSTPAETVGASTTSGTR